VLLVVGVLAVVAFFWKSGLNPLPPATLHVNPKGGPGAFPSLKEALRTAASGDRILLDAELEEADVTITSKTANLTVEAAGPRVAWRCPSGARPGDKLLTVVGASGFHLKGVTLDGFGKAKTLVQLQNKCPGLTLEDVEFRGYTDSAVYVWNCDGEDGAPVTLRDLRFSAGADNPAAIYFDFRNTLLTPLHFEVRDCMFSAQGAKVRTTNVEQLAKVVFPAGVTPELVPPPPPKINP
jgi:hypothetical protein